MRRILYCLAIIGAAQVGSGLSTPLLSPTKECPIVSVDCPLRTIEPGTPVSFTAKVENADPKATLTYNWSLSAGTITSGQGTSAILIDVAAATGGQAITATVEVEGLDSSCEKLASCTLSPHAFLQPGRKFDEYDDIPLKKEKVRLDFFATYLQNNPGVQGYIIAYDRRVGEAQARATRARNLLITYYGFDPGRVVAVNGGFREKPEVELWVVPPGALPPRPTPSIPPDKVKTNKNAVKRN